MKKQKITIKHIARVMGVTPATISKALRDSSDIALETRQRVKQLAEELGYQPSLMARSLVSQKSNLLGVLVPDLRISFFSQIVRGMYKSARNFGYETIIMVNDESSENEKRNLDFLNAMHVDGILINAVPGKENNGLIQKLMDQGVAIVAYDRTIDGMNVSSVTIDDESAAFQVMEYFIRNNRKHILFLGPVRTLSVARGRYRGYRKGLEKYQIAYDGNLVVPCEVDDVDAWAKMRQKLREVPHIDAVMCVGGLIAYGAGRAIIQSDRSIPEDVMLAEFGDNSVVHRLGVPFVTIDQSPYEMGCQSIELIVETIENKIRQQPYKKKVIDIRLIEYLKAHWYSLAGEVDSHLITCNQEAL